MRHECAIATCYDSIVMSTTPTIPPIILVAHADNRFQQLFEVCRRPQGISDADFDDECKRLGPANWEGRKEWALHWFRKQEHSGWLDESYRTRTKVTWRYEYANGSHQITEARVVS